MKWEEVRSQFPETWVLVEALQAESYQNKRVIYDMAVISDYKNSAEVWKGYKELHLQNRTRELYIFHTRNKEIEVSEQNFAGIRSRQSQ